MTERNDVCSRKARASLLHAEIEHVLNDYKRLIQLELDISVLVSEHDNGGDSACDGLIEELIHILKGGPYEWPCSCWSCKRYQGEVPPDCGP